jgi:malonyl CoA-acyl carrier protein transacylase
MHAAARDNQQGGVQVIAFMFPGQGSQYRGMGQHLFDEVREYTSVEEQVDELVGYEMRRLCLEDPENKLKQTRYTQPCLYVVNALYYYKAVSQGLRPDYLAGHSLGEYNALLAGGVFDFLTGLRLVIKSSWPARETGRWLPWSVWTRRRLPECSRTMA